MILGEIFERNARCFGSHPAVLFEGRSLSHRELASRIRRLINALAEIGCKKQDRIAVLSRNCPEYSVSQPHHTSAVLSQVINTHDGGMKYESTENVTGDCHFKQRIVLWRCDRAGLSR